MKMKLFDALKGLKGPLTMFDLIGNAKISNYWVQGNDIQNG
jgi:hypothetical protein